MSKENDKWWVRRCYGSDDCYAWGTQSEIEKWQALTGEEFEICPDAEINQAELSYTAFNLQDEINKR